MILAIAALIILWRLGIILEYPKQLIGTDEATSVLTEPDEDAVAQADAEKAAEGDSTYRTVTYLAAYRIIEILYPHMITTFLR